MDATEASEQVAAQMRVLKAVRPDDTHIVIGVYKSEQGVQKAIDRFMELNNWSEFPSNYNLETTGGEGSTEGLLRMVYIHIENTTNSTDKLQSDNGIR